MSPTSSFLCKVILPFGSRVKHIFHHTTHLKISFPKRAHFRLCFCSFVTKTGRILLLCTSYWNNHLQKRLYLGLSWPALHTCMCVLCCTGIRHTLLWVYHWPPCCLGMQTGFSTSQKPVYQCKHLCDWILVFWTYRACMTVSTELHALLLFICQS